MRFRALGLARRPSVTAGVNACSYALNLLRDVTIQTHRFHAERCEAQYCQALTLTEPRSMRPLIAHCHLGLGKLYLRTDKREQTQEHLATATTMYREMGMTYWLERAEAELRQYA
jgi:hypothetical protein